MKKVLVLGAGLVAGAHVRYLLDQPDFHVTVASRTLSKAQNIIRDHPEGEARQLNVADEAALEELIRQADLAVSLLPYVYHPLVARLCVKHRKHMVTTSYVKEPMAQLDGAAKEAGVILLNEIGVDPGIDHMTAMKVIHRVQKGGGEITSFNSYCGGLPAPEANTNPFGYKFSWSPRGVLLASKNSARYLKDGQEVFVPGEGLFDHYWTVPVEVEGKMTDFEGYPNRDSLPYMETYGITTAKDMFRGTLRNVGWCPTMRKIVDLGLLDEEERDDIAGLTFAQFIAGIIGATSDLKKGLKKDLAAYLKVEEDSLVISNLEWLGLLSDDPLPLQKGAPVDILAARMLEKMQYEEGERDMLILQHKFIAEYPGRKEKITSTMIDFGIPHGDTSMSRTVGLPAAIGVRLILQGKINLTGVHTPVIPDIYELILAELERLGIHFTEKWETLEG
jgi:saccharopine dehydrogenase-like NADP-dependent oxidoreductase